jgi:hypothetical protein
MNWKGFERKLSRPNRGSVHAFAFSDRGKPCRLSVRHSTRETPSVCVPSRLIGSVPSLLATRTASFELAPDNKQNTSVQPANNQISRTAGPLRVSVVPRIPSQQKSFHPLIP